ncbi:MAG TPA: glycosyltransferase 87 family protein [Candidatus Limnocylindrales bacterium]|nr:glycosyltransferase 87 family protein [Candidatus Limnocylindrales bacterium]
MNAYGLRLLRKPSVQASVVSVVAVLVLAFRALQFARLTQKVQWGYDFSFYWRAANHLLHGEPIYSAAQLAGPYAPQGQDGFLYPPPLAAAVTPLAAVFRDPLAAAWIWWALGLIVLVASVLALGRSERLGERFPMLAGRGRWLLVAGALAFPPVVGELVLGNVHLLLLGLLTLAWLAVRRGTQRGEWVAGAAIGVAAVIKVFPGFLVLWFLLTRRWRAAAGAAVAAVAVSVVALPFTGIQPWLDYPTVLANLSAPADVTDTLAPTVWLAPYLGFLAARILVTLAALVLLWLAATRARGTAAGAEGHGDDGTLARSFAAAVVLSVLIAPAIYQHYLTLLVLPLILALGAGVRLRYVAVAYLLMWGGQQDALGEFAWIVNRALPTAGALVLLFGLLARLPSRLEPARKPQISLAG